MYISSKLTSHSAQNEEKNLRGKEEISHRVVTYQG